MLEECRSVDRYEKLNRISEGTYGVVYRWVGCAQPTTARRPAVVRSPLATPLIALSTHYRARDRDTGEICALKKVCGRLLGRLLAQLVEQPCRLAAGSL